MSAPRGGSNIGPLAIGTIVLAVIVLALTGLTRACSFSPTAPAVDRGSVQRIDVAQVSRDAARARALRAPRPRDARRLDRAVLRRAPGRDGTRAFRLGWVTPENGFARLVQSDAPEDALVHLRGGCAAGARAGVARAGARGRPTAGCAARRCG